MKKILIISFSNIYSDPRVMRQVRLLEAIFDLTEVGFGKKPYANINYIQLDNCPSSILNKIYQGLLLIAASLIVNTLMTI